MSQINFWTISLERNEGEALDTAQGNTRKPLSKPSNSKTKTHNPSTVQQVFSFSLSKKHFWIQTLLPWKESDVDSGQWPENHGQLLLVYSTAQTAICIIIFINLSLRLYCLCAPCLPSNGRGMLLIWRSLDLHAFNLKELMILIWLIREYHDGQMDVFILPSDANLIH